MPYDRNVRKRLQEQELKRLKKKQALEDQDRLKSMTIDLKEKLTTWNEEQFSLFRLADDKRKRLTVRDQSLIKGYFSTLETTYEKEEVAVGDEKAGHKIVIIKKDHTTHSVNWRTNAEQIRLAVRYGIIPVESLTGKAIKALGSYRKSVLLRIYDDAVVSDKYLEKDLLVTLAQERIEWLQELELLVNTYDERLTDADNNNRVLTALTRYKDKLLGYDAKQMQLLEIYYPGVCDKIKAFIQDDLEAVNALINRFLHPEYPVIDDEDLQAFYAPTGPHSVMTFIKERLFHNIRQTQFINQAMTYSSQAHSTMRGDLHSACWEAFDVVTDHKADQHNLVLGEHQGNFSETGTLLCVDFSHLNEDDKRVAIMAVSQIEGDDKVIIKKNGQCHLESKNKTAYPLKKTNLIKFTYARISTDYHWLSKAFILLARGVVWVFKIVYAVVFCPTNILYGIYLGLRQIEPIDIGKWLVAYLSKPGEVISEGIKSKLPRVHYFFNRIHQFCASVYNAVSTALGGDKLPDSKYADIITKMPIRTNSASLNMGITLGGLARELIYEPGKAVIRAGKGLLKVLFHDIPDDNYLANGLRNETAILKQMDAEIAELQKKNHRAEEILNEAHKKNYNKPIFDGKPVIGPELNSRPAMAPYPLTPCQGNDVINAFLTRALKSICLTHPRAIGERHPITFFIFMGIYFVDGYAILSTHAANPTTLWEKYQATLQNIANSLSAPGSMQFVTASFTHAQLGAALSEFVIDGNKSWLVKAFRALGTDPDQLFIGAGGIVLFGQFLMHIEDIPYLNSIPLVSYMLRWTGEKIQDEMGAGMLKWMTFFGATAKLLLIIYELLEHEKEHFANASEDEFKKRLFEVVEPCYRELKKIDTETALSAADISEIEVCVQGLMSKDMLQKVEQYRNQKLERKEKDHDDDAMTAIVEKMLGMRKQLDRLQQNRADFLAIFATNAAQLPLLHHRTKREILALAKEKFVEEPELIAAIHQSLYPEKAGSIAEETLVNMIGEFLSSGVRLIASIFTRYQPAREEFVATCKEIAIRRIIHPISELIHLVGIGVTFVLRWVGDLLFNGLLARITGYGGETTYKAMAHLDCAYENARQYFSQPVDLARKSINKPSTSIIKNKFDEATQKAKHAVMDHEEPDTRVEAQVVPFQAKQLHVGFHQQLKQNASEVSSDTGYGLGLAESNMQPIRRDACHPERSEGSLALCTKKG